MEINKPTYILFYILPPCLYAGLIFFLSSLSSPPISLPFFYGLDKILHFAEYFILGYLVVRALAVWPRPSFLSRYAPYVAIIIGVLYGMGDEWHQSFTAGRDASSGDALFDALGVACGVLFSRILRNGIRPLAAVERRFEEAIRNGT